MILDRIRIEWKLSKWPAILCIPIFLVLVTISRSIYISIQIIFHLFIENSDSIMKKGAFESKWFLIA